MKRRKLVFLSLAGALVDAAVAGGVVWAAIPDSNGVIQGCYDSGGNLKVVSALPCPKSYAPLPMGRGGTASSSSVTSTRNYFQARSDKVAGGATDRRMEFQ